VSRSRRHPVEDLRGASRLAVEATARVTDLVEAMHHTIGGGPDALGRPFAGVTRLLSAPVYAGIRGVTKLVGAGIDGALARLAPLLKEGEAGPEREALLSVVNGVLGDFLADTHNPLAIAMALRVDGHALVLEPEALRAALPQPRERVAVFVHGSCMNDLQWCRHGHDHGRMTAERYTPIYLHYNSGQHVSTTGRALAELLESLHRCWPVEIESIVLVGHSMRGLVSRSACHYGALAGHAWRGRLRKLVTLGTPHHGAVLERGGNWLGALFEGSRYSAPVARLGRLRSAGVTDLRFGYVLDEQWQGRDRFATGVDDRGPAALPEDVECYAVAATTSAAEDPRPAGDGLVSVDSALGRHGDPQLALTFAGSAIVYGCRHLDLLDHPDVRAALSAWL
jgi:hypothetical protein